MTIPTKSCPRCKQRKELELFKIRKQSPDGRSSWCKACDSAAGRAAYAANPERRYSVWANQIQRLYGITAKEYESMFENQGGVCAICMEPGKKDRRLAVDHDHVTGKVRQLLCTYCNVMIGKMESPAGLSAFEAYLDRHKSDSLIQAGW